MTERRQILTSALALAIAPITFPVYATMARFPEKASSLPAPVLFVYDQRFAVAQQQALQFRAAGLPVAGFEHDLLPLWNARLHALWQTGPVPVGGLTNANALFLLETLAADYRLKLAYRLEVQTVATGESLFHWLLVPRHAA